MGSENKISRVSSMKEALVFENHCYSKNGECANCGACCTDCLSISDTEVRTIKEYVKQNDIKPFNHADKDAHNTIDFLCPFLNTDAGKEKCMIYPVRPKICRIYSCDEAVKQKHLNEVASIYRNMKERSPNVGMPFILEEDFPFLSEKYKTPRSIGQVFYPDIYTPTEGDLVVMNKRHMSEQIKYQNDIFIVMNRPDSSNHVKIMNVKTGKRMTFDLEGLTKINP